MHGRSSTVCLDAARLSMACGILLAIAHLAPAHAEEARPFVLLGDPPRMIEAQSIEETAEEVVTVAPDGARLCHPRKQVVEVVRDQKFPDWLLARWKETKNRDYETRLELIFYALSGGYEPEGKRFAAYMTRAFPDDALINALARRGAAVLDPGAWIAFRYLEQLEQWQGEEGADTPRLKISLQNWREMEDFRVHPGVHGFQVLGYHFFESERGLSPVLLQDDGSLPPGWPKWLVPAYMLEGQLLVQEASPNRFFQRIVAHHFHGTVDFEVYATTSPEEVLFEYHAARVGKNTDRNEAIFEFASRKLFLDVRKDLVLHECPMLGGADADGVAPVPSWAEDMSYLHEELPPLFDATPHYEDPSKWERPEGMEEMIEDENGGPPTTRPAHPTEEPGATPEETPEAPPEESPAEDGEPEEEPPATQPADPEEGSR